MAFDITPYIDMKPSEVRKLIREGVIDFPTAGMCRGYAQANLIILPPEYAGDFEEFARRNLPHSRDRPWYARNPRHGRGRQHLHRHSQIPHLPRR